MAEALGGSASSDELLALALADEPKEPPEAYYWFKRMERFGVLPWPGGLLDQPFLFMAEVDAVMAAIDNQEMLIAKNAELAARFQEQQNK